MTASNISAKTCAHILRSWSLGKPKGLRWAFAWIFLLGAACQSIPPVQAQTLTVFAAASLKGALDDAAQSFTQDTGHKLRVSYAGSSILARQISLGAPADLFLSANETWMDVLQEGGHIDPDSRRDIVGNSLVLIMPASAPDLPDDARNNLAQYLAGRRIAMGLVNAVPAGIYAKAALQHLGQWHSLAPLAAQTDNVRAALALVALNQTPLGIVYASDAAAEPKVKIAMRFAPESHPQITYPGARITQSTNPFAQAFLDWLMQDHARKLFVAHGFSALEAP